MLVQELLIAKRDLKLSKLIKSKRPIKAVLTSSVVFSNADTLTTEAIADVC